MQPRPIVGNARSVLPIFLFCIGVISTTQLINGWLYVYWDSSELWGRATHTDPDVRFSRIRFLGSTRFRADLHSYPLQDPVAIPRSEVCSCLSSPTCPARVSFAGYVLPSGPSPCGGLSPPLSTMPDKTPHCRLEVFWLPSPSPNQGRSSVTSVCIVSTILLTLNIAPESLGLPEFYSISSCMPRPDGSSGGPPHSCQNGCFCVAFGAR